MICAADPTKFSCLDPGDSGSGLMMERFQGGYSWEGALSFYRGCDQIYNVSSKIKRKCKKNTKG